MAYVNTTRVAGNGLAGHVAAFVKSVRLALQRRAVYEQAVRELNMLTNRELADLGISRSSIQSVARAAAYGE